MGHIQPCSGMIPLLPMTHCHVSMIGDQLPGLSLLGEEAWQVRSRVWCSHLTIMTSAGANGGLLGTCQENSAGKKGKLKTKQNKKPTLALCSGTIWSNGIKSGIRGWSNRSVGRAFAFMWLNQAWSAASHIVSRACQKWSLSATTGPGPKAKTKQTKIPLLAKCKSQSLSFPNTQ